MSRQGELFSPFGRDHVKQGNLFDSGGKVSPLSCVECGEPMEHTPSGYIVCPRGHGRLLETTSQDVDAFGGWFDE